MSFFGDLWGGIKNVGSGVFNAGKNMLSRFAPAVGGMLGQRFGGAGGAQLGSSLGNIVSGLTGGSNNNLSSGLSGLGAQMGGNLGQSAVSSMPSWAQNSPMGQLAGNAGSRGGAWLGSQAANLLPRGFQHLAPDLKQLGADFGRAGGNFLQNRFAPGMSPQTASTTLANMPARIGARAGAMTYNRTAPGRAAAAENMRHFAELPGMAAGGYAEGGYHPMHYAHGPVMYHHGGYADGGYADGGYADGGYAHHYDVGGFAPPLNLQNLVEALPYHQ